MFSYKGKKLSGGTFDMEKAKSSLEETVGLEKLYSTVLAKYVVTAVDEKLMSDKTKTMFINDIRLASFDEEKDNFIVSILFLWPEMQYEGEIDFNIERKIPRNFQEAFDKRCKDLSTKHRTTSEIVGTIDAKTNVTFDIKSELEGEIFPNFTFENHNIDAENINPEALKLAIIGNSTGNTFEVEFPNPIKGDKFGLPIKSLVTIKEAFSVKYMDITDEQLYKAEGFESLEEFRKMFEEQYNNYMDNSDKHMAYEEIMDGIMQKAYFETIPQAWINNNAQSFMDRHLKSVGGDKNKAMAQLGVKTDAQMIHKFEGEVYKQTINQMALNWYSKKYNVEPNFESVASAIISRVIWK